MYLSRAFFVRTLNVISLDIVTNQFVFRSCLDNVGSFLSSNLIPINITTISGIEKYLEEFIILERNLQNIDKNWSHTDV